MGKMLRMDKAMFDDFITKATEAFNKRFDKPLLSLDFKYEIPIANKNAKANVTFSSKAYAKQKILIEKFDSEVAWHGTAFKLGKGRYHVEDILVYPQIVTGATVTTEDSEILKWQDTIDDDTYNAMRFQGHSHVNMGTFASATDTDNQSYILKQLDDNMFYIFYIGNKKGDVYMVVYDKEDNIYYENSETTWNISCDEDLSEFIKDAEDKVKKPEPKIKTPASNNSYRGYGWDYKNGKFYEDGYSGEPQKTHKPELKKDKKSKNNPKNNAGLDKYKSSPLIWGMIEEMRTNDHMEDEEIAFYIRSMFS